MPDLSKMTIEELLAEYYDAALDESHESRVRGNITGEPDRRIQAVISELTRRTEVPAGHVKIDDGRVLRFQGGLPITADNVVVGANTYIYHPEHGEMECRYGVDSGMWAQPSDPKNPERGSLFYVSECYSTKEAALASEKGVGRE